MKRIFLHPSRFFHLRPGEVFDIDSGLGGSFAVRFVRYERECARFVITTGAPPPVGWKGQERVFPASELHHHLFLSVNKDPPRLDGGAAELTALRRLGHPEDSPEITTIIAYQSRRNQPAPSGIPDASRLTP